MTSTARIPATEITGLYGAVVKKFSVRQLGRVPDSLGVMWHHPAALKAMFAFGGKAEKWDECDANLKSFAHMAVSSLVGCSFCLDLEYFQAHNRGLDLDKAREVPQWRDSTLFTPLERDVMEYAEDMTRTPPTVTDELSARLLEALGPAGLLELTAYAGLANLYTRSNVALGIEAQGFAASCGLKPLAEPSAQTGTSSTAPTA
jgi:alkylhydroperoxidase family enzyme